MRRLATVAFLLLGVVTAAQEPVPELVEGPVVQAHQPSDTLRASVVSSTAGSLIVPQRVSSEQLKTVTGLSEAIRRFTGVQIRDYGGVGGLKTVNVRSLGSEHTGVFVDGIQIDNAQNMQVDLGRLNLDGLASVSLFSGYLPRYAFILARHFAFCASVPTVMRSTSPIAGCGRMMVPLACRNLNASIGSLKPLTAMKFAWLST